MLKRSTILVIEPDPSTAGDLRRLLGVRYAVHTVHAAVTARKWLAAASQHPDMVLFELDLPDADGLILCAELRGITDAALLVHTQLSGRRELVLSLRLGADDFVAKPSDPDELEARISAILRRAGRVRRAAASPPPPNPPQRLTPDIQIVGDLSIDRDRAVATAGEKALHLTQTEFRLLSGFARHLSEPLARNQLALLATGHEHIAGTRSLDMHVRRLRWKLRAAAHTVVTGGPALRLPAITAVRGFGYRMVEPRQTGTYASGDSSEANRQTAPHAPTSRPPGSRPRLASPAA